MSTPLPPTGRETFLQKFCRHFDVPAERFDREVLRRALYPHARWLAGPGATDFFAADRSFITSVGQLTRHRDFLGEAAEFQHDPRNRAFWRRTARMRVSIARMQSIFDAVWHGPASREKIRPSVRAASDVR